MDIRAIRDELRSGHSPSLRRRRRIAALAALGLVDFAVISLYQIGAIRRLPDLPGRLVDSNQVNAAVEAYRMGAPDGPIAALLHAAEMVLASAGGSRRTGRHPAWDLLLAGAVAGGAAGALVYLRDMVFREAKACPYCLAGAAVSFAMVPLVIPEARDAWEALRHGRPDAS